MSNDTYGNFAEPKAPFSSRRSESVVVSALEKCEQLEKDLLNCIRLIYKQEKYKEWCETNYPNIVEKLRREK